MNLPRDARDFCDDSDDLDCDKLDLSLAARYVPLRDAYFNPFYDEIPPNDGLGPNPIPVADSKRQPKQRQKLANRLCTSKSRALSRSQSQSHLKPHSHRSNSNVTTACNHHDGRGQNRGRGRRSESMRHIHIKTTSRSNSTQTLLAQSTQRDAVATNAHHPANHEDSNSCTAPSAPLSSSSLTGMPTALPSSLPSPTTTATTLGDNQELKGLLDLGSAISSALGTDDDDHDQDLDDHDIYGRKSTAITDTLTNICDVTENMSIHPTDNTAIRAPTTTTTTRTRKEWFDLVDMNQVTPEMRRRLLRRNGRTRNTYCLQSIFATNSSSSSPGDRHCHDEYIMPSWWDLPDVTPYESSMQSQASTTTTTTTAATMPAFPSCYIVKQQRQEQHEQQQQQRQEPHDHQQQQQYDQQPPAPKANDTQVYRIRVSARQLDRPLQQQQQQELEQKQQTPIVPKPGETLVYRIRVTARKLNPDEVVAWADSPTFQKPKLYVDKGLGKRQPNSESKTTRSKSEETLPPVSPPALYRQPCPSITMRDDQHYSRPSNTSNTGPTQVDERESTPRRRGATKRNTHVPPSA